MAQILPSKTNVGSQIGQSLGMGLGQGIQQGGNIGVQRGLLNQALGQARQSIQPQIDPQTGEKIPVNPVDAIFSLMQAGAGIPGSEKYLGQLAPLLLGALRTENLYGEGGGATATPGQPGVGRTGGKLPTEQEASQAASKFVSGEEGRGFLTPIWNPEQKQQYAAEYARQLNDPTAFDRGLAQAESISQSGVDARNQLMQAAQNQGISPQEMPRFMQAAQEFSSDPRYKDLPSLERAAIDRTLQIRNDKEAIRNINVPGIYQKHGGVAQHFVPGMTLYKALSSKGEGREKALKRYKEQIQSLVRDGEEPFVRSELADKGISPTEIEELIHPLSDLMKGEVMKIPSAKSLSPPERVKELENFFRTNVGNNVSLSVLREALMKYKKYGWEDIREAVSKAFPGNEGLNRYQNAEIGNLATPPAQSLSQIFGDQPNFRGFLRGSK